MKKLANLGGLPHFPLRRVAQEIGNPRVYTSIGLGIILKLFGLPENLAQKVIEENFRSEIAGPNIEAMEAGYNTVETKYELEQFKDDHIILNGSEALALGAIAAGVPFLLRISHDPINSCNDIYVIQVR